MRKRWLELEPSDDAILVVMSGLGFLWGVIALAIPAFSTASWGVGAKLLVYLARWPETLRIVPTVEAERLLGVRLPSPLLPPLLGTAAGLLAGLVCARWLHR